jgi:hypothetical protein
MKRVPALCLGMIGVLGFRSEVLADLVPLTAQFSLSASSADTHAAPATASDAFGNTVSAWQRWGAASTDGWDIYGRRFDASGAAQGAEFQVNSVSTGCQQFPAVARAADGRFVVAFQSDTGAGFDIKARVFLADGSPAGPEFTVNTSTGGDQLYPTVAMASSGAFLIGFQGPDASGSGVYARTFAANGTATSAEFAVPQTTGGGQVMPAAAFSVSATAPDRFTVAWSSLGQDGSGAEIYKRSFDLVGVALSGEALVAVAVDSSQARPRIAADASGNVVVAWEGPDSFGAGVFARRFSPTGTAISSDTPINSTTSGDQATPAVAGFGEGDFAVAWSSEQDGDGSAVILRAFNHRQLPVGTETIVNTSTLGDQGAPAAVTGVGGPLFVAWESSVPGAPPTVLGRMYRLSGRSFFTVAPCRMLDTRNAAGSLGGPALVANVVRNFPVVASACGVPASARALSLNVTVLNAAATGELVIFPGDAPVPGTSTVSFIAGVTRANNLVIALSRDGAGTLNARSTLAADCVVDVNGYFE